MKRFLKSFKYAFNGLLYTFKAERNMRFHLCFAVYVVLAGFIVGLSESRWIAVILCIGLVMAAECINTALERACDAFGRERRPEIEKAKDAAAAGVLVLAIASAAVGIIVFVNSENIDRLMSFFAGKPALAFLIAASLPLALIFIFGRRKNDK